MNWTIADVVTALATEFVCAGDEKSVSLPIFDKGKGVGIGVDGNGDVVLVLPGIQGQSAFETKAIKFEPWCETTWVEFNERLPRCAVLRFKVDRFDKQLLRLIAGVLLSLVDLQMRFNDAGHAIWALKQLFGDGFTLSIQMNVIRGLIGELLVVLSAENVEAALAAWHVDPDDRYDFSINNSRVEVKTTSSAVRQHRFTSRQLPPLHGIDAWVASVQLAEVAVGETLGGLFNLVADTVSPDYARKVSEVVVETLGVPASVLHEPQFDLQASLNSIRFFQANLVPTPTLTPGTSDLKWTAYLSESNGIGVDKLNELLSVS